MSSNDVMEEKTVKVDEKAPPRTGAKSWRARLGLWLPVAIPAILMLTVEMGPEMVGVLGLIMMLGLVAMKVPVGAAMALAGILGILVISGPRAAEGTLSRMPYESTASWSLTVIPMFVLMGVALFKSGITAHLYTAARQWAGWLPGGLGVGTTLAGAGFAALSGSTLGSIYPLTRAGAPEMLKAGYDKRLAIASIMGAGTLAHLIPPSLFLVVYAGVAGTPIGPQLMAGLLPGVVLAVLYCLAIIAVSLIRPSLAGGGEAPVKATWPDRWSSLGKIWPAPVLTLVVIIGVYQGFMTATEAGSLGALGAILIALVMRRGNKPFTAVGEALASTVTTVGAMFFLIIGAHILTRMLTLSGLTDGFVSLVAESGLGRVQFLLLLIVVYILLGMFMDPLAMMLLTVPVLLPLFDTMGISPVWFGVFLVVFMELAILTPPVGVLSFIIHGLMQDKEVNVGHKFPLPTIFMAACWVIPVPLVLVLVMIAVPDVALWIPNSMNSG